MLLLHWFYVIGFLRYSGTFLSINWIRSLSGADGKGAKSIFDSFFFMNWKRSLSGADGKRGEINILFIFHYELEKKPLRRRREGGNN